MAKRTNFAIKTSYHLDPVAVWPHLPCSPDLHKDGSYLRPALAKAAELPEPLHFWAGHLARMVCRFALLVARDCVLQLLAFLADVVHWASAVTSRSTTAFPTCMMATFGLRNHTCQLFVTWYWALDVTGFAATRASTLRMTCPNRLKFCALVLEAPPWLWARLMASKIIATTLMTNLHAHHLLEHGLVKIVPVVGVMLPVLISPPLAKMSFISQSWHTTVNA